MRACTCRLCGPLNSKSTITHVTISIAILREGWEDSGFGRVWGEVETEHELRASVAYYGVDEDSEVEWLDQAALDGLDLTDAELEGAIEKAEEAAFDAMREDGEDDSDSPWTGDSGPGEFDPINPY